MIKLVNNIFVGNRIFIAYSLLVLVFILAFIFPFLFPIAQTALVLTLAISLADILHVFHKSIEISCSRNLPNILSLGSDNRIDLQVINISPHNLTVRLIDELPFQLQKRDFEKKFKIKASQTKVLDYAIRPTQRGEYNFGNVIVYLQGKIGFFERRIKCELTDTVSVYPSILENKKQGLKSSGNKNLSFGLKKIRRIGHSYEFEQIKEYTIGDDYQTINWKASGRTNKLMVNKYTDEKAQQVYTVIDKSRSLKMPFNGLSLLDYSLNACLIIAKTALAKHDKAGLITFSDKLENFLPADRKRNQMKLLFEALYREKEARLEANYELLYTSVKNSIRGRSLLFLFSNFESMYALERNLRVLRSLNKLHLLVVIVFENGELVNYHQEKAHNVEDIYFKTIAQKIVIDKKNVLSELKQYGIQTIYTKPENLNINVINKYLELKARGMI